MDPGRNRDAGWPVGHAPGHFDILLAASTALSVRLLSHLLCPLGIYVFSLLTIDPTLSILRTTISRLWLADRQTVATSPEVPVPLR